MNFARVTETFVLRLPLGAFGNADPKNPAGWTPNPLLAMTAQQQFNHNVDAGYLRLNVPTDMSGAR